MIERGLNVIWLLIALGTVVNAWTIGLVGSMGPDSGLFPMICGVIIAACGLILLVFPKRNHAQQPDWPKRIALLRIIGVVGGLVTMAILLPYLGFAISAGLTTFVLLQTVERSKPVESIFITALSIGFVMYVFDHLMGMTLPRSPWGW